MGTSQVHLSNQYYDICIRRARSYCSICYDPYISSTTASPSFGLGANAIATIMTATVGSYVTGVTTLNSGTIPAALGGGDYIEILAMQAPPTTSTTVTGTVVGVLMVTTFSQMEACKWAGK